MGDETSVSKKSWGLPDFVTVTFVFFLAMTVILGPANLVLFFKNPKLYTILIGLVIGLYIVHKL